MKRRAFVFRYLPAVLLAPKVLLLLPKTAEARERRVSDFLRRFSVLYLQRPWDAGDLGRLLVGINGHIGNLNVYVNGQLIPRTVDQVPYDPDSQVLQIRRADGDGEMVFNYDPRHQAAPVSPL